MLLLEKLRQNQHDLTYVSSLQQKGAETGDGSLSVTYRNQVILSTMGIPGSLLAGWMVGSALAALAVALAAVLEARPAKIHPSKGSVDAPVA